MTYAIDLPRSFAAMYLAWEFGAARANKLLRGAQPKNVMACPRAGRSTFIRLTFNTFLVPSRSRRGRQTKSAAEGWAQRIREALSYQEGRLGRPLTAGGGCVVVAEIG